MSARNELARIIRRTVSIYPYGAAPRDLDIADAILAAGYRKTRTVTTPEELDELPDYAVLMYPPEPDGQWAEMPGFAFAIHARHAASQLPAVVLYTPGETR